MLVEKFNRSDSTSIKNLKGKPKDPNHRYLHGIVTGEGLYYAVVIDIRIPYKELKPLFTGTKDPALVDRLVSNDINEIKKFYFKHHDAC